MPDSTNSKWRLDTLPTSSISNSRSRVMICDAFTTESFGRPVARAGRSTLPGASAQRRLLVSGTQTMVLKRLRLSASPWTISTGRRKPGPDPVGSGRVAQYTCPWAITIQRFQAYVWPHQKWPDQAKYRLLHKHDSSRQSRPRDHDARYIRSRLPYRPGFLISSVDGTTAPHHGKLCREWKWRFSYPNITKRPTARKLITVKKQARDS